MILIEGQEIVFCGDIVIFNVVICFEYLKGWLVMW